MLSVSILLHKWVAAIAVGIAAVSANLTLKEAAIPIVLFSIATPLGMLIGLAVHAEENLAIVVINTFSAGTFIYVACTEIVQAEFAKQNVNRWLQFGSVFAGGVVVALLSLFGGHDHSGEGHGH
jgi:zinc transporter ZupT